MTMHIFLTCLVFLIAVTIVPPFVSVLRKKERDIGGLSDEIARLEKQVDLLARDSAQSAAKRRTARIHAANEASAAYLNSIQLDSFRRRISTLAGCDDRKAWEADVDDNCGGMLSLAKKELPQLPQDDIILMSYLFAGLSYVTIRLLTGETLSNLYSRKSRLISMILSSDAPDKARLAEELKRRPELNEQ